MPSCAHCGAPATRTCAGCRSCPTADFKATIEIFYCSETCQVDKFTAHKQICKNARQRRGLQMVCETLRDAMRVYRTCTYERPLHSVERVDYEDGSHVKVTLDPSATPIRETGRAFTLPEPLWSSLDCQTQDYLLFKDACEDSLMLITEPLAVMLETFAQGISVVQVNHNGGPVGHSVCLCILKSQEAYVIDISGAQYGYDTLVFPFESYINNKCSGGVKGHLTMQGLWLAVIKGSMTPAHAADSLYTDQIIRTINKKMIMFPKSFPIDAEALLKKNDPGLFAAWLRTWLAKHNKLTQQAVAMVDGLYQGFRDLVPADLKSMDVASAESVLLGTFIDTERAVAEQNARKMQDRSLADTRIVRMLKTDEVRTVARRLAGEPLATIVI